MGTRDHPEAIEESAEVMTSPLSITEKIRGYHDRDRKIGVARSALVGVLMPSTELMRHLRHKHHLSAFTTTYITTLESHVAALRTMYMDLFNSTADWNTSCPDANVEFALNIMEAFERYCSPSDFSTHVFTSTLTYPLHRIKPLPFKCGELLFSSTTRQFFRPSFRQKLW
jgi:hypothetical protein